MFRGDTIPANDTAPGIEPLTRNTAAENLKCMRRNEVYPRYARPPPGSPVCPSESRPPNYARPFPFCVSRPLPGPGSRHASTSREPIGIFSTRAFSTFTLRNESRRNLPSHKKNSRRSSMDAVSQSFLHSFFCRTPAAPRFRKRVRTAMTSRKSSKPVFSLVLELQNRTRRASSSTASRSSGCPSVLLPPHKCMVSRTQPVS